MVKRRRITELDGLRAFAIMPVMLIHFAPERGPLAFLFAPSQAGWVGVDLFFVLSGFFITTILLSSVGKPNFYRTFILRRARRILPLYYVALTCFTLAVYVQRDPATRHALLAWGGAGWFYLFVGNVRTAIENKFPPVFSFVPLWSLQVEEQFYLLYPLLIATTTRATLRKVLIGCILAAPLLRLAELFVQPANDVAAYVLTPFRMDALALGGLVALVAFEGTLPRYVRLARIVLIVATLATLGILIGVSTSISSAVMRSVGYSFVDSAAAALLVLVLAAPKSRLCAALRFAPLVYIGQISFGLYLLHVPAAYVVRSAVSQVVPLKSGDTLNLPLSLAAAFVTAAFSWAFFESKIVAYRPGEGVQRERAS